jgi:hypothetical protein
MATPTNLPAAEVDGTPLPASWLNDLRGAFRILQVVQGTATTVVGNSTTGFADTTLSASITPQSSTSKVLVIYSQNCYSTGGTTGMGLRLLRNSTTLDTLVDIVYGTNTGFLDHMTATYLDSPASTSALTYKTQFNRNSGGGIVYVQPNTNRSSILLFEVSA